MTIREVMNGKAQACRTSPLQVYLDRKKITPDLPDDVRMERLVKLFQCFADSTRKISDNFHACDTGSRLCELNNAYTEEHLSGLQKMHADAVTLMRECLNEMSKNPLSLVNGTSAKFLEFQEIYQEEEARLASGRIIFEDYLNKRVPPVQSVPDRLQAKMASFFSAFLLFPDILGAAI